MSLLEEKVKGLEFPLVEDADGEEYGEGTWSNVVAMVKAPYSGPPAAAAPAAPGVAYPRYYLESVASSGATSLWPAECFALLLGATTHVG